MQTTHSGGIDRDRIAALLGGTVGQVTFTGSEVVDTAVIDGVTVETRDFQGSHGQTVRGLYVQPRGVNAPALLYCHAHGARYDIGIRELIEGRPALTGPYLSDLAAAGYAVLCLEMPTFGSRRDPDEHSLSKAHFWHGTTLFGQMLAELLAGAGFLAARGGVDPARIGAMGISMGGTHAWWLAALDRRIAAVVSMCCFADLRNLVATGAHDGHGHYMTVPGLLALADTADLAGLAVPRPQLHCIGTDDWSTPPEAFALARQGLEGIYAASGSREKLAFHVDEGIGHTETAAMRATVLRFLAQNL